MNGNQRISANLSENLRSQQALLRKQNGFTLLELMFVVGILGMLATFAIPSFTEWRERGAVNNATVALYAKLKQARSLAVAESRDVKVSFDAYSNITMDDNIKPDGTICSYCKNAGVDLKQFSKMVLLAPVNGSVSFSRKGVGSVATMRLKVGTYYKCITVNVLGRAYIGDTPECVAL